MSAATLTTAPAGRVRLGNLYVMIDGRPYQIVNMNIVDVLIAGAPDWIAPRQKLDFSFVLSLDGKERALPTFGVVVRNDAQGLEAGIERQSSSQASGPPGTAGSVGRRGRGESTGAS